MDQSKARMKKLRMVIAVQLAVMLVIACVLFLLPRAELTISPDQITAQSGVKQDGYWTIDDSFSYNGAYFTSTPGVHLARGSYTVEINYQNTYLSNLFQLDFAEHQQVKSDTLLNVPIGEGTISSDVYILSSSADLVLRSYYQTGRLGIGEIRITQNARLGIWTTLLVGFAAILIELLIYSWNYGALRKENKETRVVFCLLAIAFIGASVQLIGPGLPFGHDLDFHINRIEGLREGLLSGQFPVRVHPFELNGYGYATSLFYPELFLYIPAVLRVFNLPVAITFKLFLCLINLGTILIAYYSFKEIFKTKTVAAVGALLYATANFRLVNIYLRGALGESLAMMFFPLIAAALYDMLIAPEDSKDFKRGWVLGLLGYSGVIQSHILSCLIIGIFTILFCLFEIKRVFQKNRFVALVKTVASAAAINAWFLVPFVHAMFTGNYKVESVVTPIQTHGIYLRQAFDILATGAGLSHEIGAGGKEMSYSLGLSLLVGFAIFLFVYIKKLLQKKDVKQISVVLIFAVLSVFMSTYYFPYDGLQSLGGFFESVIVAIQFPWRYMSVGTCFFVILFCYAAAQLVPAGRGALKKRTVVILSGVVLVSCVFVVVNYQRGEYGRFDAVSQSALASGGIGNCEYLPEGCDRNLLMAVAPESDALKIENFAKDRLRMSFSVRNNTAQKQEITLPVLDYPGYRAMGEDNQALTLGQATNGELAVTVPASYSGTVTVDYKALPLWNVATVFSILSLVAVVFAIVRNKPEKAVPVRKKRIYKA